MARLTEKELKKLRSTIKFKGHIAKSVPRWKIGDRKAKRTAKAWNSLLQGRLPLEK